MNVENQKLIQKLRQEFHANPELSGNEYKTQRRIIEFLRNYTDADTKVLAKTGAIATFDSGEKGPHVLIRGDIDALPIEEVNTFSYRSKIEGVSHKCGHDGHIAILLGIALELTINKPIVGKVSLLFQPSEENGKGAQLVIEDPVFKEYQPDFVFALHNLPGYDKHEIVVRNEAFTCNVKSIIVKLYGKTAHAAEPEQGNNPACVISEVIKYAKEHTHNKIESEDFFLMTPVYANLGDKAYGISAGYGEVHLTIRSWSVDLMNKKSDALQRFIYSKCKHFGIKPEISWTEVFHANINYPQAVDYIKIAAEENQLPLNQRIVPFKWGEDFGLFTQKYHGAMFGLGSGKDCPALHNPDYDYPDEITPSGVNVFLSIIRQILN